MQAQRVWPMVSMAVMQQGIKLPAMLPNFDEAIKNLKPVASYSWIDKDGIYSHYQGSGVEVGAIAAVGVTAAVVMPALAKIKKKAKRLVSATNLKSIGAALNVYAFDYQDKYPPNFELLIKEADLNPKSLVSSQKPKNFKGPSYIYISGQTTKSDPGNILVYENPAYQFDSTNVLFVDGHVERVKCKKFIKDIKGTYKRLGKEAPEIKFLRQIKLEKKIQQHHKEFEQQMKKSREKVKKQLQEQKKKKDQQNKEVKSKTEPVQPKPVEPKKHNRKKVGRKVVADVRPS
jgi:prepilin-type processing-associated H-X9-DG protein